jgi:Flp pilus assembly protein TadD
VRTAPRLLGLLTIAACGGEPRRQPPPAPPPEAAPVAAAAPPVRADAAPTLARDPLLGTCAAAAAAPATADALVGALLDEAGQRLDAGAWADAFTCADMAADRAPRSIEAHHLRGAALAGAGRDDEARIAYDLALALDPEDPETLRAVADFYVNVIADKTRDTTALGLELARRGSARATARRRGQADLRAELALIEAQGWNDLGRADLALERAAAAIALDATLTDALHEHGVALFNLGRFRDAAARLEQVLAARPDEPYAHHMLGLALEQLGRGPDAAAHLARARALAPDEFPPPVAITDRRDGRRDPSARWRRCRPTPAPSAAQVPITDRRRARSGRPGGRRSAVSADHPRPVSRAAARGRRRAGRGAAAAGDRAVPPEPGPRGPDPGRAVGADRAHAAPRAGPRRRSRRGRSAPPRSRVTAGRAASCTIARS